MERARDRIEIAGEDARRLAVEGRRFGRVKDPLAGVEIPQPHPARAVLMEFMETREPFLKQHAESVHPGAGQWAGQEFRREPAAQEFEQPASASRQSTATGATATLAQFFTAASGKRTVQLAGW